LYPVVLELLAYGVAREEDGVADPGEVFGAIVTGAPAVKARGSLPVRKPMPSLTGRLK
jgi:hypothetical protein